MVGKFVLIGVVSYGAGCAAATPGIYARVQGFLPWIKSLIADGKNPLSRVVSLVWVYLYPIQFLATYSVIKHLVFVSYRNGLSVTLIPKDFSHPILKVKSYGFILMELHISKVSAALEVEVPQEEPLALLKVGQSSRTTTPKTILLTRFCLLIARASHLYFVICLFHCPCLLSLSLFFFMIL